MKSVEYDSISRNWEFIERHSEINVPRILDAARRQSRLNGSHPQSLSQTRFIVLEAQILHAQSVILVADDPLPLALSLMPTIPDGGSLTVIVTSSGSLQSVRDSLKSQANNRLLLRIIESSPSTFLSRLNSDDYDLIVVSGQAENYTACFQASSTILHRGGLMILTDALANHMNPGHGLIDPADRSAKTVALRTILRTLDESSTFQSVLLSIGTGVILARRSDPPRPRMA